MTRRFVPGLLACVAMLLNHGCGGSTGTTGTGQGPAQTSTKRVVFVGFDASEPLVQALKDGRLQGLVVQNPVRMGEMGVKTLVAYLDKQKVEPKISTGETLVTRENMEETEIAALIHPPRAPNRSEGKLAGAKAKKWRVIVIPKGTTHQFWESLHAGVEKAVKELGNVEAVWQGPQKEDDRTLQIQLVQNAIATGVDGIVLAPLDAKALVEPVEKAVARGIPVVIIDSGLQSSKTVAYVATDNYHGGVLAARRLGEVLKGEGKIILLRYAVGSESTEQRENGFIDTMAREFPRIQYLSKDEYAGATSDTAQQTAQRLITRFRGQVDGIFCPNESSAYGMLRALEGAGMVAAQR
jgi:ribose transport system substrate-binding protein